METQNNDQKHIHVQRERVFSPGMEERALDDDLVFSIVSYNILADCHILPGYYSYISADQKLMVTRHGQLMVELKTLNGDVVCLQEVGPEYYRSLLLPAMEELGYQGVYFQKALGTDEGETTFFKQERFSLAEQKGVILNDLFEEVIEQSEWNEEDKCTIRDYFKRDHVLLITKMKCSRTENTVTVGNLHTFWGNWKNIDVTTLQIALAAQELNNFSSDTQAHILCGDFNMTPKMPGYQLMQEGCLPPKARVKLLQAPQLKLSGGDAYLVQILEKKFIHCNKKLKSAYKIVEGTEPVFTNYEDCDGTGNILICSLDYIWFNSHNLDVTAVLKTVSEEQVKPLHALPNAVFPSDHISLQAWFMFH
uniref:2',5'-phosphodiesterase 12-like n=1 Tax=Pristiophorus japonicus TaxID=55135 RepID=UPI00398E62A2